MSTDNEFYWDITDIKRQAVIVRSEIERFTNQFFFDRGFVYVEPPVLHEAIANKKAEIYLPVTHCLWVCTLLNFAKYLPFLNAFVTKGTLQII